jgi:hypothetical protein
VNSVEILNLAPWNAYPMDVTSPLPSQRLGSSDSQGVCVDKAADTPTKAPPPPPPKKPKAR